MLFPFILVYSKEKKLNFFNNNYGYTCSNYIFCFVLIDLYNGFYENCLYNGFYVDCY